MPVRFRITILFAVIVFTLLSIVCGSVYYFSYTSRFRSFKNRLVSKAITSAKLFNQSGTFDRDMIERIDSSITLSIKEKFVQVYDSTNAKIYQFSDLPGDTLTFEKKVLDNARLHGNVYFRQGKREIVAHYEGSRFVIIVGALDQEGINMLHQLFLILAFSFVGALLIAILGGYIFSTRLLLPIRKIADEVNEISAQSLTRRIHAGPREDEWNYLAVTLNQLLNRLQESFDIQKRFIANASHELSTPLASISSQLEVSLQRDRDAAMYRQVMQSVYEDVSSLTRLTHTLLEFAKASGNASGIEIDLVRIDEILLQIPREIQKMSLGYNVVLQFNELPPEEEKLVCFGNEALLLTAIRNIVVNSCKYSLDHLARLTLSLKDNEIFVSISDEGLGIPLEERERIFQPFYRIEGRQPSTGFGLGLSLASRIIKLHKGTIQIESNKGVGSVFIIMLPNASK